MQFNLEEACIILDRTPGVLNVLLANLGDNWIRNNEGSDTFSPFDVVGHLIHGEKTDCPDRITMILEKGTRSNFVPYDRFAMYELSKGKELTDLLDEFDTLRKKNMVWLRSLQLQEKDLDKEGMHPSLGVVTLRQLLATTVAHDLTHIAQITRVMAKQYKDEIGPWLEFFRIMNF